MLDRTLFLFVFFLQKTPVKIKRRFWLLAVFAVDVKQTQRDVFER